MIFLLFLFDDMLAPYCSCVCVLSIGTAIPSLAIAVETTRFVDHQAVKLVVVHARDQMIHKPLVLVLVRKERRVVAFHDVTALAKELFNRRAFGLDEICNKVPPTRH